MAQAVAQRVLIVEDEQHLAEGLRFNLEAEGFEAEVLDNGERALARLLDPAAHFDLVVLDVMLPGKDGFAVVRELRQRQHYVPVLMLTARGRPGGRAERLCRRRRRLPGEAGGTGHPARAHRRAAAPQRLVAGAAGRRAGSNRGPSRSTIASLSAEKPSISTPSS